MLALIACTVLTMSLLAGCGKTDAPVQDTPSVVPESTTESSTTTTEPEETTPAISDDPIEKLTQGYFMYEYNTADDGSGMSMSNYFHFYKEAPVIGGVFYAGFAINQINFVGTYKVEEKPYDYNCYADRAAVQAETYTTGTAPYTITCYDFDGNEMATLGYDGNIIYNNAEALTCVSTRDNMFLFDDGSQYPDVYAGEVGQKYLDFVADDDATASLTLYHNGTYLDMMVFMVEGTWAMEEGADGYTYKLTPNSSSDTPATAVVALDKATAVYTPDDGDAMKMTNTATTGPKAQFKLVGQIPVPGQDNMFADFIGLMLDDGTVTITASMSGFETQIDQGTWTAQDNGYAFDFNFDNAGALTSGLGEAGAVLQYVGTSEVLGAIDTTMVLGYAEEPAKVVMLMKGEVPAGDFNYEITGEMFDNNTCKLVISAYGQQMDLDAGTYSTADGYNFTFQFDAAGEIASSLGEGGVNVPYAVTHEVLGELSCNLIVSLPE